MMGVTAVSRLVKVLKHLHVEKAQGKCRAAVTVNFILLNSVILVLSDVAVD
jgi:hypothetical protein